MLEIDRQDENPYFNSELRQIFIDYGGLNMWTTDRLKVSGTTTQLLAKRLSKVMQPQVQQV